MGKWQVSSVYSYLYQNAFLCFTHTHTLLCQRQQLYTNCTCLTHLAQCRVSPVPDPTTKSYIHAHMDILSALNQHNFINMQPLLTHRITHKVKHEFKHFVLLQRLACTQAQGTFWQVTVNYDYLWLCSITDMSHFWVSERFFLPPPHILNWF